MVKKYFDEAPPFINRVKEQEYLHAYLQSVPTNILFLYGPKSTGKTTMIEKVIRELDQKQYAVNYLDMREILITDFSDFRQIFFPEDLKGKVREILSGIKINTGFFGWDVDDEKLLQTNIFAVMHEKLVRANAKGIRPVIILDEFQYLRDVIIDRENNILLVEELFKFFIALTKVRHLAHVICLTSDSYYLEELYHHAKLKNTSQYFLIDHLGETDIRTWLTDEGLDSSDVEYFWSHLGGSVWEIWQILLAYKNSRDYRAEIQTMIADEYAKSLDFLKYKLLAEDREVFERISRQIARDGYYDIGREEIIDFSLIQKAVDLDIWFYDARRQKITANSQTVRRAFDRL